MTLINNSVCRSRYGAWRHRWYC